MMITLERGAGLCLAALLGAALAAGAAQAASQLRIAPPEPERVLAQKPTQPGGAPPAQQQRPAPGQPQQQQQEESDEPVRLEPLPSGNELQAFVQRAIRPGFENIRSLTPVPNASGVFQVQNGEQALPSFFVNLVEERNVIAPDQAVAHFQRGFGVCRNTQAGERSDEGGLIIQHFTATCRTQAGNDVYLFIIAGHDDQRTQVLTFMTEPRFADALRERAENVFQAIVSGG